MREERVIERNEERAGEGKGDAKKENNNNKNGCFTIFREPNLKTILRH